MSRITVVIPPRVALAEHVYGMKLDTLDLSSANECVFDFRKCNYGEPLPLLLPAHKVKALARKYSQCKFLLFAGNESFHTFADHIGLFRYMGWPRGREPGEAFGSQGYIPVEVFDIIGLNRQAGGRAVGGLINAEADRLAIVLSQQDQGATFDVLQYAIREILRNSVEHSKGRGVTIQAQYWPNKEKAEIVIIDDGVGIPATLYENEYIECNNAREAIKFALLPGISGVSLADRVRQDAYWGNSGFGLFVTSRVCSQNGVFRIISDSQGLTLRGGVQIEHDWKLAGTCVQMILDTKNSKKIQNDIPRFVEEGESQRVALMENNPIKASAASKMLASQYRKWMYS